MLVPMSLTSSSGTSFAPAVFGDAPNSVVIPLSPSARARSYTNYNSRS